MTFKSHELDFLRGADLGRLATIQPDGTPQNSPVGFTYNEELGTIDIAGYRMSKSQKFRNIARNNKVAFVVDDITSRDPWRVRCLEIRGTGVLRNRFDARAQKRRVLNEFAQAESAQSLDHEPKTAIRLFEHLVYQRQSADVMEPAP